MPASFSYARPGATSPPPLAAMLVVVSRTASHHAAPRRGPGLARVASHLRSPRRSARAWLQFALGPSRRAARNAQEAKRAQAGEAKGKASGLAVRRMDGPAAVARGPWRRHATHACTRRSRSACACTRTGGRLTETRDTRNFCTRCRETRLLLLSTT